MRGEEAEKNYFPHQTSTTAILKQIAAESSLKPFIIVTLLFVVQQFSGQTAIICYARQIFTTVTDDWDSKFATLTLGAVILLFSLLEMALYRKVKMHILMLTTTFLAAVVLFGIGAYSYFAPHTLGWVPILGMMLYSAVVTLGIGSFPWIIAEELFPIDAKALLSAMLSFSTYLFTFLAVKFFPQMMQDMQPYGTFFFFGSVAFVGFIFLCIVLPSIQRKVRTFSRNDGCRPTTELVHRSIPEEPEPEPEENGHPQQVQFDPDSEV